MILLPVLFPLLISYDNFQSPSFNIRALLKRYVQLRSLVYLSLGGTLNEN